MFPTFRYNSTASQETTLGQEAVKQPPFNILITHQDVKPSGTWRPQAVLQFDRRLRTSGFLLTMPPDDLQTLLVLLTFLTPNGHCAASLQQLASALHLSAGQTRLRLERLTAVRWLGQPMVLSYRNERSQETFVLAPGFIPVREEETRLPAPQVIKAAPRAAIIEHSRRKYARPRAQVERQIAELNGWPLPDALPVKQKLSEATPSKAKQSEVERPDSGTGSDLERRAAFGRTLEPVDPQKSTVRKQLIDVGLLPEQADELLARFALVRIQRQLMWLPYRAVRNRAGFLLAAIKDDYAAPTTLFRRRTALDQSSPLPGPTQSPQSETLESQGAISQVEPSQAEPSQESDVAGT